MKAHASAIRTGSRRAASPAIIAALVWLAALAGLAAPAHAAPAPAPAQVSTGGASAVGFASATLHGTVDPRGSDASYYFQYGPTSAYGSQTAIADAGAGTATVGVSVPVVGLQPLTQYHYRLVAVNGAGASDGADRTLLTTKVPLSLQILSTPDPVSFGGTAVVQGTLSGTGNGGREVVLQEDGFPFSAGFQNLGNPELTNADGGFSFPVLGLTQATQFRVITATSPPVLSPVALESVTVRVAAQARRAGRRSVRILGTVTPAEPGQQVGLLRIVHGRSVLAGGTTLRGGGEHSRFSMLVRARPGLYRVLALIRGAGQSSSYSATLTIG